MTRRRTNNTRLRSTPRVVPSLPHSDGLPGGARLGCALQPSEGGAESLHCGLDLRPAKRVLLAMNFTRALQGAKVNCVADGMPEGTAVFKAVTLT